MNELELMASVFESSIDSKLIVNNKGKIYRANRAAEKIFLKPGDKDLQGRNMFGLVSGGSRVRLRDFFSKLKKDVQLHEEVELKVQNEMKVFDINANAFIADHMHLLIFRDVTQKVREMETRSQFIAVAGHELKTPLAVISAYTDLLLRKSKDNPTSLKYLKKIAEKNKVLTNYIESILDEIRIGTGKFTYDDKEYKFESIVRSAVEEIAKAYPEFEINLIGKSEGSIFADKERISQVVRNFLVNAIKHSQKTKPIEVEMKTEGWYLALYVTDHGPGIALKDQSSIFKAFYRKKESRQSQKGGLGLGLYISKQIIKKYNGEIGVTSRRGKGATFYFKVKSI